MQLPDSALPFFTKEAIVRDFILPEKLPVPGSKEGNQTLVSQTGRKRIL